MGKGNFERASRTEGKIKVKYKAKHLYKYYLANTEKELALDNGTFYKVVMDMNNLMMDGLINGETFMLGAGLGDIGIRRYKHKGVDKVIDFHTSMKIKKKVYYTNLLREGYRHFPKWYKKKTTNNIYAYSFAMVKTRKIEMGKKLKNDPSFDYLEQI